MTEKPIPDTNASAALADRTQSAKPGLIGGMVAPFRGVGFVMKHPRLITLAIIPILINTVLFAVFFFLALRYFDQWLSAMLPSGQSWYWIVLTYFLMVVLVVLLLLIFALSFTAVANILASPFHDALSSRTEFLVTGQEDKDTSIKEILVETGRTVMVTLKMVGFYLLVVGGLLLLNLIPLVGSVLYSVLFFVVTILWLALGFFDFALARHQYRFGQKIGFIRRHLSSSFGYGLGIFLGLLIPLMNLVFIPLAVVGGTLLYLDLNAVEVVSDQTK